MVDQTPRFGLNRYEPGDTDWDHSDTVTAVDETAIERGPIEDRPTEGRYDDELYHAVDQRITWRWDAGTMDWKPVGGLGSADHPVPGTSRYESVRADAAEVESLHLGGQPALPAADMPHVTVGPPVPTGNLDAEDFHNTSVGALLVPRGTIHLGDATVVADRDGRLAFGVYEWTSDEGYVESDRIETLEFAVEAGKTEIALNTVLEEPDGFDAYAFVIDSDVELYREMNRTVDTPSLEIPGGGNRSGRLYDNYYYLFDLQVVGSTGLEARRGRDGLELEAASATTARYPVVNPDTFGAGGDGETDDSAAIREAIDAIPDGEQGVLEFSGGKRYRVSESVEIDVGTVRAIHGNGAWLVTDADIAVLDVHGSNTGVSNPLSGNVPQNIDREHSPVISDLNVCCDAPREDAYGHQEYLGTGLRVADSFGLVVRDCYLFNLRHGLETTGKCRNLIYAGNHVYDCYGSGLRFSNGLDLHQIQLTGNVVMRCHKLLEFTRGTELDDLTATGNNLETGANSTGRPPAYGVHVIAAPSEDESVDNTAFHRKTKFVGNHFESHGELTGPMLLFEEQGHSICWIRLADNLIKADTNGAIKFDRTESPEPTWDRLHNLSIVANDFRDPEAFAVSITGYARQVTVADNQFSDDVSNNRAVFFEWDGMPRQPTVLTIAGNSVLLNEHPKAIDINCDGESIQSFSITDNTFHRDLEVADADSEAFVVDLRNVSNLWELTLTDNQIRAGGAEGYRIDADDPSGLGVIKNNSSRVTNTTDFEFPTVFETSDSFAVRDNVS